MFLKTHRVFGARVLPVLASVSLSLAALAGSTETLNVTSNEIDRAGYTVELSVDFDGFKTDEPLYEIPGALTVGLRQAGVNPKMTETDDRFGNYVNFRLPDHTCPVIEAVMPGPAGRVGLPLAFLGGAKGEHRVVVSYTGVHFSITVDGRMDDDMPFTSVAWPAKAEAKVLSPRVKSAKFAAPARADALPLAKALRPVTRPIQYWTPDDHNAWVGDVATGWHRGRFHVFYLYDRRHHKSKGGKGGHFFAHLSSTNLVDWVEHPHATPITERWETQGTGTPFECDGKYYLSYGLHTARLFKRDETTDPAQMDYYRKNGKMGVFRFDEIPGVPMGATYAVSDDGGMTFRKSNVLFHTAQNPTVFNRPDGKLELVSHFGVKPGFFLSDHLGDWTLYDDNPPTTGDCPCLFAWHGWTYIVQGFNQFAASREDGKPGTWQETVSQGWDVYDGLAVPMVSPFAGDRRIMAGWIRSPRGWGGWLCLRELVYHEDGTLGVRWLPEAKTPVAPFVFDARPDAPFVLRLEPETPAFARAIEFRVDPAEGRAQFSRLDGKGVAVRRPTAREKKTDKAKWEKLGLWAQAAEPCYAVENIRGLDRPYRVRFIQYYDPKGDATIFDAEIAGDRTILCRVEGRYRVTSAAGN